MGNNSIFTAILICYKILIFHLIKFYHTSQNTGLTKVEFNPLKATFHNPPIALSENLKGLSLHSFYLML